MVGSSQPARRFALVLLEEGEDYVADWIALCRWPRCVSGNWQSLVTVPGTLRLCSKSLFFEPDDIRMPIVRLPIKTTQNLEPEGRNAFTLTTSLVVKMKANMADVPYLFEKGRQSTWSFTLVYAQMADFLPEVHQYLAASRLSSGDQEQALQILAQGRANAAVFDTSRLVEFTESVVYDAPATQHTPLVKQLGRLVISNKHLYFQALDNVAGGSPVRIHPLAHIAAVVRRRSSLRPLGMEVFFIHDSQFKGPTWGAPSAFFAFDSEAERGRAVSTLTKQEELGVALPGGRITAAASASILEAHGAWLQKVTMAWQHGRISNLDYLLYCNLAAGRSFNDLTQWPVFPWVLADYVSFELDLNDPHSFRNLSLPMGAINTQRLEMLRKRYREMPREQGVDQPFLYGTHYSCPGYVMFWLVRAAPGHLLRLQNGRFDSADRLFVNLGHSYNSATCNPADVKELIPEFYLTDPSFLVNDQHLPLGTRQNGTPVGNVELPLWAKNPVDFLTKHRAALESPVVSANLHHWIDLIFGWKQQGAAAEEADNVFHHLTYEGAVDIASISDPRQRQALEMQINEFGQCPSKIFEAPHPRRLVCPTVSKAHLIAEQAFSSQAGGKRLAASLESDTSGRTLSLALLSTIMAATQECSISEESMDAQVQQRLQQLDVLLPESSSSSSSKGTASKLHNQPVILQALESGHESGQRGVAGSPRDRFRDWGSNLGGQISSLMSSIAKDINLESPGRVASAAAAHSRLRGLFQRQIGQSKTPPASCTPQAATIIAGVQELPLADTGAETQSRQSSTALREDTTAEELATALGISPPNQAVDYQQVDCQSSANRRICGESSALPQICSWGPGFQERLHKPCKSIAAFQSAVTGVACHATGAHPMVYCVSQAGSLKMFNADTSQQIRATNFSSMPLTSVVLLPSTTDFTHPIVLSGCYDNKVYAYSVEYGRLLGNFEAHEDTVSCLSLFNQQLLSGSQDGTVRKWSLSDARTPWDTVPALPEAEIETEGTVVSLSAAQNGVVVTGSKEGSIAAWDLRSQQNLWEVLCCSGITGVSASPDERYTVCTGTDGSLSVLDIRKAGAQLARVQSHSPLLCCQTDGDTAVAGADSGQVLIWDIAQHQGRLQTGAFKPPLPDGLYPALQTNMSPSHCLHAIKGDGKLLLAVGHRNGSLSLFSD